MTAIDSNASTYCHYLSWSILDDKSKFIGKVKLDDPEAPTKLIIDNLVRSVEPGEYPMKL